MTCKECGQLSAVERYKRATGWHDDKTFSIFGYGAADILEALTQWEQYKMTKVKMTKEEAYVKVGHDLADSLEILGLIEFEKETIESFIKEAEPYVRFDSTISINSANISKMAEIIRKFIAYYKKD